MLNINEIKKIDAGIVTEMVWKIASLIKGMAPLDPQLLFALVYSAYVAEENNIDDPDDLLSHIEYKVSEQRAMFVKELAGEYLDVSLQLAKTYDENHLLGYLYIFPRDNYGKGMNEFGTPESISKLALKILGIKDGDKVADMGSGVGDFLMFASERKNPFYGIELNTYSYEISKIRTELFADNAVVELGDMFTLSPEKKFDKIFSNYPFGMRISYLRTGAEYVDELHKRIPDIKKATSSDWIFNSLLVDHLADKGKAVAVMTNGSTWNSIDQKIREYFVRSGLVEAVIALPARLFEFTSISTTLIVMSKGNKSIRLIDAKDFCEQGRRQNIITDSDIDAIIRLLDEDGEEAINVDLQELAHNDFVLNPSRYLEKTVEIEDGVEFGSLMKRITRGAPIKASELDEMVSDEPTDTQYLMLSNIQNGMIAEDLPYLKELDSKLDKYCISNRNLLLSKNGAPFKVAVAEVEDGRKLLGNGNLFIIELDEEKVNPYFLKAFLDSEVGTAVLKSIVVGATIPNISAESLKKLIVPLPSMEKQEEIAKLYQAKQDEIRVLQLKLQKAQNDLRGIFGEVN